MFVNFSNVINRWKSQLRDTIRLDISTTGGDSSSNYLCFERVAHGVLVEKVRRHVALGRTGVTGGPSAHDLRLLVKSKLVCLLNWKEAESSEMSAAVHDDINDRV